jgi:Na+-transporting methylmalonyl-CoA/oxaloacetate decarboxylase gamma subunit
MMELLGQGAAMTVVGMALVFGALAVLWGFIAGLTRLFPAPPEPEAAGRAKNAAPAMASEIARALDAAQVEAAAAAALTEERAQVAAIVAGALMANALPKPHGVPAGPAFEHGRAAPSWVSTNRAQALQPWQPPRQKAEGLGRQDAIF